MLFDYNTFSKFLTDKSPLPMTGIISFRMKQPVGVLTLEQGPMSSAGIQRHGDLRVSRRTNWVTLDQQFGIVFVPSRKPASLF